MTKLAVEIEPLGDRVVVMPDDAEKVTKSGIVIPDTQDKRPQEGTVLALGKGGIDDCPNPTEFLSVGQKVLFGKYAGDDVKLKDEDGKDVTVKILQLSAILGKIS